MDAMNSNAVAVKLEPPDDFDAGTSENIPSPTISNGITETEDISAGNKKKGNTYSDSRNFTCLLCDIVCSSRDDLRKHLKNSHASKSYSTTSGAMYINKISSDTSSRTFSGYVNYRYTCPVCGAKFKSFRTYLTHNMSHRGINGFQPFDEARMMALLGNGKQYMQDYLEAEDGCAGTFTCNECKTVFMQRDAYAMHMMMRAMNETCKSSNSLHENSYTINNDENVTKHKADGSELPVKIQTQTQLLTPNVGEQTHQRCLEDVTAKIDQDEYLKSVLDKVCAPEVTKLDIGNYNLDERKFCSFCRDSFVDQDSLAMHVMSDHAEEMSLSNNRNNSIARGPNSDDYVNWMAMERPLIMNSFCRYCNETFISRDSLALHVLTHAHLNDKARSLSSNNLKRKSDSSVHSPPKALRFNTEIENRSHKGLLITDRNEADSKMYCKECDIKFYAVSEYEWHIDRHREGNLNSYDQPLCLTKNAESNGHVKESGKICSEENNRRRRNSFSCELTDKMTTSDMLPKRPVSVGDYSSDTLKQLSNQYIREHREKRKKQVKTKINSNVLSTINSLSSSEQRIIYSVFGNDLGLNVEKEGENSTSSSSPSPSIVLSSAEAHSVKKKEEANQHLHVAVNAGNCDAGTSGFTKTPDPEEMHRVKSGDSNSPMCKYCEILFFNKAIYYLHMGLHNVNNPWQCNICGKICTDAVDFAAHVIHM